MMFYEMVDIRNRGVQLQTHCIPGYKAVWVGMLESAEFTATQARELANALLSAADELESEQPTKPKEMDQWGEHNW